MDFERPARDTRPIAAFGTSSRHLAGVLNAAFAEGLLSEQTHSHRLGLLFEPGLVDQRRLVGDLRLRRRRGAVRRALDPGRALLESARLSVARRAERPPFLLALGGLGRDELLLGRHPRCDIVLEDESVSRRHAQILFRDGIWVIRDLGSTNGTTVNGARVGRSSLCSGDVLGLGAARVQID